MSSNLSKKTRIPRPLPSADNNNTNGLKSKPTSINPLAKAMEKKSKKELQPESWYEEKVISVSQKQQEQTITEHGKRKEALFAQLKKTEEELVTMQDLLIKREKLIKEAQEENDLKDKENDADEDVLVEENVETGCEEQPEKVEKITKKSMKHMRERMQAMKEKLQAMNKETDYYLSDMENTVQYLESLEVASGRFGPLSNETRQFFGDNDDEQIIAKIYKENKQPEEEDEEVGTVDDNGDDVEDENICEERMRQGESSRSKIFLTERSVTSHPVQNNDENNEYVNDNVPEKCDD